MLFRPRALSVLCHFIQFWWIILALIFSNNRQVIKGETYMRMIYMRLVEECSGPRYFDFIIRGIILRFQLHI